MDEKLRLEIISAMATLISTGYSESRAASTISLTIGWVGSWRRVLNIWKADPRPIVKWRQATPKCVYCGQQARGEIIPVMDWRRVLVAAHEHCELYEQLVAGGL